MGGIWRPGEPHCRMNAGYKSGHRYFWLNLLMAIGNPSQTGCIWIVNRLQQLRVREYPGMTVNEHQSELQIGLKPIITIEYM